LSTEMQFGAPFALRQRVSEKPPLVARERPRADIDLRHDQFTELRD